MKNDYGKNYFWKQKDVNGGKERYFFNISNQYIEVSKEVYKVCFNSYMQQYRALHRDNRYGLISLDYETDNGTRMVDTIADKSIETNLGYVIDAINNLSAEDQELITELLILNKKEHELAKELHTTQQNIHKKKVRILKKLKKILFDGC